MQSIDIKRVAATLFTGAIGASLAIYLPHILILGDALQHVGVLVASFGSGWVTTSVWEHWYWRKNGTVRKG